VDVCLANDATYASRGLVRDEYPFASTNEGAAKPGRRYSARPVDATDNRTAGAQIGAWYRIDRILDNDHFT